MQCSKLNEILSTKCLEYLTHARSAVHVSCVVRMLSTALDCMCSFVLLDFHLSF